MPCRAGRATRLGLRVGPAAGVFQGEGIMLKRWIKATLITLGLAAQAHAQMPPPPAGAPFYPPSFANNPVPLAGPQFCPTPGPGPGPGPGAGPGGQEPDSPFSLKRDGGPNAFDEDCGGC